MTIDVEETLQHFPGAKHDFEDWQVSLREKSKFWFRVCKAHEDCAVFQMSENKGESWMVVRGCRMPDYA